VSPHRLLPWLAISLLPLLACTAERPRLPALGNDAIILAFGDSLTYGTGAGRDASYPAVLARLTGRRVINAGVPGELSASGLRRLPATLRKWHPDLLILCHGGNDLLQQRDGKRLQQNLEDMVRIARRQQVPVVLIAVPRPSLFLKADGLYARVAERFQLPLAGEVLGEIISSAALKSDQVHPNARGYRMLAQRVYRLLRDSGAL